MTIKALLLFTAMDLCTPKVKQGEVYQCARSVLLCYHTAMINYQFDDDLETMKMCVDTHLKVKEMLK